MLPLLSLFCVLFISVSAQSIPSEIIVAAALGVTDGATLRFTSVEELLNDDHTITCVIEIENWTKYPLMNPIVHINSGAVTGNPVNILPGTREVMVARKTSFAPSGSSGTVSWEISGKSRLFVVMWEVPFVETFYNNLLGVGLTAVNVVNHAGGNTWYEQMSQGGTSTILQYAEKEFSNNDPNPILFHHDNFLIEGTMTSTQESHVRIFFTPSDPAELAPSIAEHLAA